MPASVWSKLFPGRDQSVVVLLELRKPPEQAGTAEATGDPEMLLPPGVPVPWELQLPAQPGDALGLFPPWKVDLPRLSLDNLLLFSPAGPMSSVQPALAVQA